MGMKIFLHIVTNYSLFVIVFTVCCRNGELGLGVEKSNLALPFLLHMKNKSSSSTFPGYNSSRVWRFALLFIVFISSLAALWFFKHEAAFSFDNSLRSDRSIYPKSSIDNEIVTINLQSPKASSEDDKSSKTASSSASKASKSELKTQPSVASLSSTVTIATPVLALLSANKPVKADVRGNLGPPSVITQESTANWLTDRWQAAKDMSGDPIPGKHWVEIDLERECVVDNILIDWESAYCDDWLLRGRVTNSSSSKWVDLVSSSESSRSHLNPKDKQHIIQTAKVEQPRLKPPVRYVRLSIRRPATRWGSSIWRMHIYGYCMN